jgi:hypothetical protein
MKELLKIVVFVTVVSLLCTACNEDRNDGDKQQTETSGTRAFATDQQVASSPVMIELGNGVYYAPVRSQAFIDMLVLFKGQILPSPVAQASE